jgi:hypothetical protein
MVEDSVYYPKKNALLVFTGCTLLYGAIHVFAWHAFFSSNQERLLWHISSIYMSLAGLPAAGLYLLAGMVSDGDESTTSMLLSQPLFAILGVSAISFYGFCRAFLVVESFISLRWMPVAAYETPNWTQYIPHF